MQLNVTINDITATTIHIPANPQSTMYKNLETSRNLCIVRMSFSTISENSPKITWRPSECFPTSITVCKTTPTFYHVLCNLIGSFLTNYYPRSLNIYQFDCSALRFLFEFSSNKSTKSTSCFIFLYDLSKITKLMKKKLKKATEGIS